jgi:hypothetical protein
MSSNRAAQFARLDELVAIPDAELTEAEGKELEELAHLFVDAEYQDHVKKLAERPEKDSP